MTLPDVLAGPGRGRFGPDEELLRDTTRRFVAAEIVPHVDEWEEAGSFPRDLYRRAGEVGILGVGYPEELGGTPVGLFGMIAVWEEVARCGSGGVAAGLGSHHIALPPIIAAGDATQRHRFVPPVLAGDRIAALAVTEPDAGSDVAAIRTRARREGDHYVVDGAKTFITSGCRADQFTVAVRTGGEGHRGLSLLVVDAETEGFSRSGPLRKMGWWASDTAFLSFDGCRVPLDRRIGAENEGFPLIMANFQRERLQLAVAATATAEMAILAAWRYAQDRHAFGRRLLGFQVTRHKLVDVLGELLAAKELVYRVAERLDEGEDQVAEVSLAKIVATRAAEHATYEAVQILGGAGYLRGTVVERCYRDARILAIGGGTTEIMKEIVAKRVL